MDPLIGAGLISGVGSLGASLFSAFGGQHLSKDMMDYQYKLQQQAIDAQNLYNSPAEQMKRLNIAGLNPNLVYGNGVDGNQSSAASPSMGNRNLDLANPLQDLAENYKASRLLEIQEKNSETERAYTAAKTVGQLLNNKYLDESMKDRLQLVAANVANTLSDTNLKESNISLNASKANNLEELTRLYTKQIDLTEAKTVTERLRPDEIREGIKLIKSKINVNNKQVDYLDSLIAVNGAKVQQLIAMAYYYNAGTINTYARTEFQNQMNKIGFGNMSKKDKVNFMLEVTKLLAGMATGMMNAGAGIAKAAL